MSGRVSVTRHSRDKARKCPAWGKTCKQDHFQIQCHSTNKSQGPFFRKYDIRNTKDKVRQVRQIDTDIPKAMKTGESEEEYAAV